MAIPQVLPNTLASKAYTPQEGVNNPNTGNTSSGGNGGSGGGNQGGTGGNGPGAPQPRPPIQQTIPQIKNQFPNPIQVSGGPSQQAQNRAGQSFSNINPHTGGLSYNQDPAVQMAQPQGFAPGMQYANQQVTGQNIPNNPFVQAAEQNFQRTVLPGIQDQFNNMGLGRSSAAGNAMAMAQGQMLEPLYQQAAQQEQQRIQNQISNSQFMGQLGLGQQQLGEQGAQFDLGMRQQEAQNAAQGQQQLFQNLLGLQGQQFGQNQSQAGQLFGMGQVGQQTGQAAYTNAYQDFLRQQGLSEAAVNPFGNLQGLLGTVTTGK